MAIALHPLPPEDFNDRSLPIRHFSGPWYRIHPAEYGPLFFGTLPNNRFNAPDGEFGVLYVGWDPHCAFIETFGSVTGTRLVATSELEKRSISAIASNKDLVLLDLTGSGLARLGADNRLCDGPHEISQAWSRAIWGHPDGVDGIVFRARHDPERLSIALYNRPGLEEHLAIKGTVSCFDPVFHATLAEILDVYGFGLC